MHWYSLQVKATGTDVVLQIRPTYLDEVTQYEPDPSFSGKWKSSPAIATHIANAEPFLWVFWFTLLQVGTANPTIKSIRNEGYQLYSKITFV